MKDKKNTFLKGALAGALAMLIIVFAAMGVYQRVPFVRSWVSGMTSQSSKAPVKVKLELLEDMIEQYYLYEDEIDPQKQEDGIYSGYIDGLDDPYSVYFNEEATIRLREATSGEFSGIGAGLNWDQSETAVEIVRVYDGTPAQEAGLQVGDIIYQVDDRVVSGEDLSEIVSWIRGKEGTDVALIIYRDGEQMEFTVTRRTVQVQTVSHEMRDNQIGYISISEFDRVTYGQFEAALTDLEAQGMQGLVVDLRYNPGGNLDVVVNILQLMLPEGMIVSMQDKNGRTTEFKGDGAHVFTKPLVVLVNEFSASASEIFAGAIQDYGIGQIVGETTYGKGVVQNIIDLQDGTSLKLTVAEYFTPKGRSINRVGVVPDVEVAFEADPENASRDNQLEKALEIVSSLQ